MRMGRTGEAAKPLPEDLAVLVARFHRPPLGEQAFANSVDEVLAHVTKKLDAYSGAMPLRGRPSRGREAVN